MGEVLTEVFDNWAGGINTSVRPESLPDGTSPRGYNTALDYIGSGHASIRKRRGCRTRNVTAISGVPSILGGYDFKLRSGSTYTNYLLLVSDGGRLDQLTSSDTLTTIDASAFTAGTYYPDFTTANNLCFIVNGQDRKKFNGTALQNFGITRPTVGTMAAADGGAGLHSGTYELRVAFGNSSTGHESSISDTASATVTITNKALNWTNVPVSADTQVDRRYLYIRNTSTMVNFYRAGTISDNSTTTATTSALDANLITLAPDTAENDPPPSGVLHIAWHRSRLFVADNTKIYYSKVGLPEAFDPEAYEQVNPDDGQRITAILSDGEVLIIFKSNSTYVLFGDDPQSWVVRQVHADIGCVSHRSVVGSEQSSFWWSERGPIASQDISSGAFTAIGQELLGTTIGPTNINYAQTELICAAADVTNQRIMFAVPEVGQAVNTAILPYNYRVGCWESNRWDPMDVGSLFIAEDSYGQPWVQLGGNKGQVFQWWDADSDGMRSTSTGGATLTKSGTFVAAGTTATTITQGSAVFDTNGNGLIERKVTIVDSNGRQVGSTRPRITSNNATSFTMVAAVTGLTVGATYTYYIGGPAFEYDTKWSDAGSPYQFTKKRMEFLYVQALSTGASITVAIDLAFNYNSSTGQTKSVSFDTSAPSALWDTAIWDSSEYGTQSSVSKRLRVGRTGWIWRVRFRQLVPDQTFQLTKVGMRSELLTDKLG